MADPAEILSILKDLVLAYPEKKIEREGLLLLHPCSATFPRLLRRAVRASPPRLVSARLRPAEFGSALERVDRTSLSCPGYMDDLLARILPAQAGFLQYGHLDPTASEAGRNSSAASAPSVLKLPSLNTGSWPPSTPPPAMIMAMNPEALLLCRHILYLWVTRSHLKNMI
jgi:hypothetical protein